MNNRQYRVRRRARSTVVWLAVCVSGTGLLGCAPGGGRAPGAPAPAATVPAPVAGERYAVVAGESTLLVRVYRGGTLAALGHNHVIRSTALEGTVTVATPPAGSAFELALPVASLEVDPPDARSDAGPEFATELDAAAIEGTRANMLGPRVLDAAAYPTLRVAGTVADDPDAGLVARAAITVRGVTSPVDVPVKVTVLPGGQLVAAGRFTLRQTALGLEPFTVMMGALAVRDELDVEYRIVARRASGAIR